MTKVQTIIRAGAALLVVALWTGEARAQSSVVGTWELAQIDGNALPAVLDQDGDCREEVVSATLTIAPDSTWRLESNERDVCPNKTEDDPQTETGRWRVDGNNIEMLDKAGKSQRDESGDDLDDVSTGTIDGDTLTLKLGKTDKVVTFRRRTAGS